MTRDEFVKLVDACTRASVRVGSDLPAFDSARTALLAAFDAQAAEVEALRAEVERLNEVCEGLRGQFVWQTKNADNCRADASRMGDRALLAESLLAEADGALRGVALSEWDNAPCYCVTASMPVIGTNGFLIHEKACAKARAVLAKIGGGK
jgi:hypothetical protein